MNEETLVILHPMKGFQFVREFVAPDSPAPGMVTLGYSLDAAGCTVREWCLYPTPAFCDGCESIPPNAGKLVQPESIALNVPTLLASGRTINTKPKRLIDRWATYTNNRPSIVRASSLIERLRAILR